MMQLAPSPWPHPRQFGHVKVINAHSVQHELQQNHLIEALEAIIILFCLTKETCQQGCPMIDFTRQRSKKSSYAHGQRSPRTENSNEYSTNFWCRKRLVIIRFYSDLIVILQEQHYNRYKSLFPNESVRVFSGLSSGANTTLVVEHRFAITKISP